MNFDFLGVWIHIEAEHTPEFNAGGFIIAPDRLGTLINDLSRFLDVAAANNVFVIPVLWNGALMRNQRYRNIILNDAILQSYIDNALIVSLNLMWENISKTYCITFTSPWFKH